MAKLTPKLLEPKQELFCQKFIELGNASEAYRQSYDASRMKPETVNRKAKELKDNGKITARIFELQGKHAKRHNVTVDSLIDELEEVKQIALQLESPQVSAAVSAIMGKAKICGLDKQVVQHEGETGLNIKVSYE